MGKLLPLLSRPEFNAASVRMKQFRQHRLNVYGKLIIFVSIENNDFIFMTSWQPELSSNKGKWHRRKDLLSVKNLTSQS